MPFPKQANFRAEGCLDLVHGNVCGPIMSARHDGRCYFLLLVDDFTRYMWVVLLAGKGDAAASIHRIQAAAEAECGRRLRVIRTDLVTRNAERGQRGTPNGTRGEQCLGCHPECKRNMNRSPSARRILRRQQPAPRHRSTKVRTPSPRHHHRPAGSLAVSSKHRRHRGGSRPAADRVREHQEVKRRGRGPLLG
jgi:hypothetical protein